ncbi:MAG TPA: hypothetical protein VMT90_09730 [Dehalococcoidia bacterium]|jgi:hypothetical protein|nr:hypothetical protein [Dehalococcoidia bacterium]
MFKFWLEWALAIHRAVWFPVLWATGLERAAVDAPPDIAALGGGAPALRVIEGGLRAKKG